jgi:phosphohistidine phosphatase
MGRLIRDEGLTPDLIIASSAKRCRKTAECIIHDSSYRGETRITAELYEADGQRLKAFVAGLDDKLNRVLLIAHNPGLEQLLEDLTGVYTPLTTCALAKIELPIDSWSKTLEATEPRATVPNVWQPRELAD